MNHLVFFSVLTCTSFKLMAQEDCNAVLKVALQTTEFKTEEAFDQHLRKYFFSDEFKQDTRDKRFKGKKIDDKGLFEAQYDDHKLSQFRQVLASDQTLNISSDFKLAYLETKANKDVLDAWVKCLESKGGSNKLRFVAVKDSDEECVVSLSHIVVGGSAKILNVIALGCEEKTTQGKKILTNGAEFGPGNERVASFVKKARFPDPSIVVSTTMGSATISMTQYPPPPLPDFVPEDDFLKKKEVQDVKVTLHPVEMSEHLRNQDFSAADNSCLAELSWEIKVTPDWLVVVSANGKIWEPRTFESGVPKFGIFKSSTPEVKLADFSEMRGRYGKKYDLIIEYAQGKIKEGIFTLPCRPGGGGVMPCSSPQTWLINQASVGAGGGKLESAHFELTVPKFSLSFIEKPE